MMKRWQKILIIILGVLIFSKIWPEIFQKRYHTVEEQLKYADKYDGIESTHASFDVTSPFKQYFRAVKGRAILKRTWHKFAKELDGENKRKERIWILSEILNTYFAEEGVFINIKGKGYKYAKLFEEELKKWKGSDYSDYQRNGEEKVFILARFYEETGKNIDAIRIYRWIPADFSYEKLGPYSKKTNWVRAYEAIGDIYGYRLKNYKEAMKAYENMAIDVRDIPEEMLGAYIKKKIEKEIEYNVNIRTLDQAIYMVWPNYESIKPALTMKEAVLLRMYYSNCNYSIAKQKNLAERNKHKEDVHAIMIHSLKYDEQVNGYSEIPNTWIERLNKEAVIEGDSWNYISRKIFNDGHRFDRTTDTYQYLQPNGTYKTVTYNTPEYYEQEKIWQEKYGNVDLRKLKLKKLWN